MLVFGGVMNEAGARGPISEIAAGSDFYNGLPYWTINLKDALFDW